MEPGAKTHHRLPGRASGLAWYHRLWLATDHLLAVRTVWFTEEYKRFYFRDIQAILIAKTTTWKTWNLLLGVAAGLVLLVAVLSSSGLSLALLLGLGGLLFVLFLVNLLQGPTCICQIRTAVQTERLPTLRRLRTARKVIARLKPIIAEAQGPLAPEQLQPKPAVAPLASANT